MRDGRHTLGHAWIGVALAQRGVRRLELAGHQAPQRLDDRIHVVGQKALAGLPFTAELDSPTARLLEELDGSRTLEEALATTLESDDVREVGFGLVRRMLQIGFLELADDAEETR